MNKKALFIILSTFMLITANAVTVLAREVRVLVNGDYLETTGIIIEDRTLLPVRAVGEAVGGDVDWNSETRQVTLIHDETTILLTIDDTTAIVNGEAVELDVPAKILNDRTFLPLRFIGDILGFDVDWVSDPPTAILNLRHTHDNITLTRLEVIGSKGTAQTVYFTSQLLPRERAVVRITGQPETVYNLRVRYASGYSVATGLGDQISDSDGLLIWNWVVGSNTSPGSFPIIITLEDEYFIFEFEVLGDN
ncbi:MAG: copper amine oxidase N-terminal domain-containing protein [Defluviitaleaceae bacterium]|nr:copper amine oxidase N-terminal domain-containing protein [Defluviitaleaceae bacterium]